MIKTKPTFKFYTEKPGPKSKIPDREELFKYRKTHSVADTATHFNASRASIYRWTNYYIQALALEVAQNGK